MNAPFIMTVSPMVQVAIYAMNNRDQVERIAAGTAQQINDNEEVATSLKVAPTPGFTLMRQVNIQATPSSPVVLTTWTCWDHMRECWLVFVESPLEKHFEQSRIHEELN